CAVRQQKNTGGCRALTRRPGAGTLKKSAMRAKGKGERAMPAEQEEPKKVSIDEIARALGVSKTTGARALSGKGRISQATRARVQDYLASAGAAPAVRSTPQVRTAHNLTMVIPSHYVHLDPPVLRH